MGYVSTTAEFVEAPSKVEACSEALEPHPDDNSIVMETAKAVQRFAVPLLDFLMLHMIDLLFCAKVFSDII